MDFSLLLHACVLTIIYGKLTVVAGYVHANRQSANLSSSPFSVPIYATFLHSRRNFLRSQFSPNQTWRESETSASMGAHKNHIVLWVALLAIPKSTTLCTLAYYVPGESSNPSIINAFRGFALRRDMFYQHWKPEAIAPKVMWLFALLTTYIAESYEHVTRKAAWGPTVRHVLWGPQHRNWWR